MKTGFFKENSSQEFVILLEGKEIARYASIKEFVYEHAQLLESLQDAQDELLESYYKAPE
mgnify:FL=1|tara:strand:- start:251 stop:430 length:180 start_codon:yes stop_codon:yes gene_type:complete